MKVIKTTVESSAIPRSSPYAKTKSLTAKSISVGQYRMKPNLVASWKAMGIEIQTERKINNAKQHDSSSPRPPSDARKNLQGISRSRRDGQMASAKRIHRQGAQDGRQSWWHLQNVVHEFHDGQESFLRRDVR